jgi:hypothetical protein
MADFDSSGSGRVQLLTLVWKEINLSGSIKGGYFFSSSATISFLRTLIYGVITKHVILMTTRDVCNVSERKNFFLPGAEGVLSSSKLASSYPDLVMMDIYSSLEFFSPQYLSVHATSQHELCFRAVCVRTRYFMKTLNSNDCQRRAEKKNTAKVKKSVKLSLCLTN